MIPAINKPILVTRHTTTTTGCVFTNIIMGNTETNVAIMKTYISNYFPTIFITKKQNRQIPQQYILKRNISDQLIDKCKQKLGYIDWNNIKT